MFGRFFMRGTNPMTYVGIKVMADHMHGSQMPRRLDNRGSMEMAHRESMPRVQKLAEWQPVFNHASGRPPMVKRNGGLRGSTATKWRR